MNTIPLYERGRRPDPPRGLFDKFTWQYLDRASRWERPMWIHELLYGIPCGPPRPPKDLLGLAGIIAIAEARIAANAARPLWAVTEA